MYRPAEGTTTVVSQKPMAAAVVRAAEAAEAVATGAWRVMTDR